MEYYSRLLFFFSIYDILYSMEQNQKTADAGEIKVDTKSKVLFLLLGILIAGSINSI
jgi:hypothetical protein